MTGDTQKIREKIKQVKSLILSSDVTDSFLDVIQREKDAFKGFRVLYASDNSGLPLQKQHNSSPNWVSVFNKRYFLAWSDEIAAVYRAGRELDIAIATRPLMDTNLWSDLPTFYWERISARASKQRKH